VITVLSETSTPATTVRRFYDAFNAQDLDGLLSTLSPAIMFIPVLGPLYNHHAYRGHAGMRVWYGEIADRWDGFEAHIEDVHEMGGFVIAFVRLVAHRGERQLEAKIAVECRVRAGRIHRMRGRDYHETAEQLGVSPLAA
jgi:ketosteroid isomerase-like protein